jgi:hypothetical protein
MHNEITDDTGKVYHIEVSDYNIIYVGGLSPNLTYGKSYSTLKLNNSMYLINNYIINDSGDMVGKRKSDNLS